MVNFIDLKGFKGAVSLSLMYEKIMHASLIFIFYLLNDFKGPVQQCASCPEVYTDVLQLADLNMKIGIRRGVLD